MSERQGERGERDRRVRDREKQKEETQKETERNTEGSYSLCPLCIEFISIMYTMENDTYSQNDYVNELFYLGVEHPQSNRMGLKEVTKDP